MTDSFRFLQFSVHNSASAQKVGTDGVLLGAWATPPSASQPRILDVGTGTGLIALMLAQRTADARILGIDISPEAVEEASLNFRESSWAERLSARLSPLQNMCPETDGLFDLIVSNPPFFVDSLKAPSPARAQARHADALPAAALADYAGRLLSPCGRLAVVYPPEEGMSFVREAEFHVLKLCRITKVFTNFKTEQKNEQQPKRLLLEFSREVLPLVADSLNIRCDGAYTSDYESLVGDFYLPSHFQK